MSGAGEEPAQVTVELSGAAKDAGSVFDVLKAVYASDRDGGPTASDASGPTVWSGVFDTARPAGGGPGGTPSLQGPVTAGVQGGYVAVDQVVTVLSAAFTVTEEGSASGDQVLEDAAGGGVALPQPLGDLGVGGDGDAFGDQVLLDHFDQVGAVVVLRVGAGGERVGVEVRLAAQLDDALGQFVGVLLLLLGVFQELRGHRLGVQARDRVVVPLVAQGADDLGGEGLVEDEEHALQVRAVGVGDRALLDLPAGPLADGLDVGQELGHGCCSLLGGRGGGRSASGVPPPPDRTHMSAFIPWWPVPVSGPATRGRRSGAASARAVPVP